MNAHTCLSRRDANLAPIGRAPCLAASATRTTRVGSAGNGSAPSPSVLATSRAETAPHVGPASGVPRVRGRPARDRKLPMRSHGAGSARDPVVSIALARIARQLGTSAVGAGDAFTAQDDLGESLNGRRGRLRPATTGLAETMRPAVNNAGYPPWTSFPCGVRGLYAELLIKGSELPAVDFWDESVSVARAGGAASRRPLPPFRRPTARGTAAVQERLRARRGLC